MWLGLVSTERYRPDAEWRGAAGWDFSAPVALTLLLIASLGAGFAALFVLHFVVRLSAAAWPPPDTPPIPLPMWFATAALLASSGTMHAAWRSIRAGRADRLTRWLTVTSGLAAAFLVLQGSSFAAYLSHPIPLHANKFLVSYYVLAGTHALHLLGGVAAVVTVTLFARRGDYTAARCAGVACCALYWHFVDVAWLAMFALFVTAN